MAERDYIALNKSLTDKNIMRKVYHLEKGGLHYYYGSLKAVFNAHKDLGVSKGKLDRYDFSVPYENENIKLRVGVLLSASEAGS